MWQGVYYKKNYTRNYVLCYKFPFAFNNRHAAKETNFIIHLKIVFKAKTSECVKCVHLSVRHISF